MKTYHIGREEVYGYVRDFISRLRKFEPMPMVWCPVTESGDDLLQALLAIVREECPELLDSVRVLAVEVNDGGDAVHFVGERPEDVLPGQTVLLFDGAVHSGRMMRRCTAEVLRHRPAELCSYSLVIKRGSSFIPTLWGVMIEESDRAYFLLDDIPNNRMDAGTRPQPLVHLQKLGSEHLERPPILSGVPSIDRMTWGDRYYQMQTSTSGTCTYVLERGPNMVGFLTLHFSEADSLTIDEIVVAEAQRGGGYAGVLLRFAETVARHAECHSIRLNALRERIPVYDGFRYRPIPGKEVLHLGAEEYQPMEKAVLYHQSPIR
jgi:GNAT superfamily N-acetyltransferase